MFDVNFDFPAPQLLCHPELKAHEKEILERLNPFYLRDHFILFSSGTTGGNLKGYALSKSALFANARASNAFFGLSTKDVWGLSLPIYHVGGLSVLARAHLLKNKIVDVRKWDPIRWHEKMEEVTITTIVPTQLYDLVKLNLRPHACLRYLIVGGDFLSSELKRQALELGWPVIRTFGMSEVSSQLANARAPTSDDLVILPIHKVKIEEGQLFVKSEALFTLEFTIGEQFKVTTAKQLSDGQGFYRTRDRAELKADILIPLGRIGDEIKSAGHLVNINQVRDTLSKILLENNCFGKIEIFIEPDERKNNKLILLTLPEANSPFLIRKIKDTLSPIKIDEIRIVDTFQRTVLGKLKKI